MYENVLVPVTEQSGATGGLHHTSAIAQWPDARIQLLFIADRTHDSDLVLEETVGDVLDQEGKRIVEEVGPPPSTHTASRTTRTSCRAIRPQRSLNTLTDTIMT